MKTLHLEITRSSNKWAAPFYAAVLILVVLTAQRPGVYLWSDVTWEFNQASALINPVLSGMCCFEAARRVRAGFAYRLRVSQSGARPVILHFAAAFTWYLVGVLAAAIFVTVYMGLNDGWGEPVWLWVATTQLSALCAAAIGYTVGLISGFRWYVFGAVPVVMYVGWLGLQGVLPVPYWITQLYPVALNGTNPFVRYITSTLLGQVCWYVGLTVLVLTLAIGVKERPHSGALLYEAAGGIGLLLVGGIAVFATNGQFTTGLNARQYVCGKELPEVCLQPAFAKGIGDLSAKFRVFNGRVEGTNLVVARLEQQVPGVGDEPSRGARSLYLEDLGGNYAQFSLDEYVQTYAGSARCTSAPQALLHVIVDDWLRGKTQTLARADGELGVSVRGFQSWSLMERNQWLRSHIDAVESCRLHFADFRRPE